MSNDPRIAEVARFYKNHEIVSSDDGRVLLQAPGTRVGWAELLLGNCGSLICHGDEFFLAFRIPGSSFLDLVGELALDPVRVATRIVAGRPHVYLGECAREDVRYAAEDYEEGETEWLSLQSVINYQYLWGDDQEDEVRQELMRIDSDSWEWSIGRRPSPELLRAQAVALRFIEVESSGPAVQGAAPHPDPSRLAERIAGIAETGSPEPRG